MMNKAKTILLLLLTGLVVMTACKPDTPELQEPGSKLDGINDMFTLTSVVQVDQLTSEFENTLDVSSAFIGNTPATIMYNSADFTWTYTPGDSPDYIGASGTWAFDDNEFPTLITMTEGANTYDLTLLRTIRPQDATLEFQLDRSCGGAPNVSYQYTFTRN
jgi:hypothetical protein